MSLNQNNLINLYKRDLSVCVCVCKLYHTEDLIPFKICFPWVALCYYSIMDSQE